jgi:hypothetical protein
MLNSTLSSSYRHAPASLHLIKTAFKPVAIPHVAREFVYGVRPQTRSSATMDFCGTQFFELRRFIVINLFKKL